MVNARSLKHLRYVVVGKTPEDAILSNRTHYWCEGATWSEELGAATIFQDYADARDLHKKIKTLFPDMAEKNKIKVEIIPAKVAMIAKLRHDGAKD